MSQHLQFPQPDQYPSLDLDLSPGSADSLAMAGLGRPRQAGMPPFVQYASLSAQGSGAGELAAGLQAFAAHTGQHGFVPSQGSHSMMRQFMHDPTSPWNPLIMSTEPIPGDSARRQAPGILLNPAYSTFGSFRSVAPPSEADTVSQSFPGIPTDSGYGSIAKPSVGNPSVYDGEVDQSVETQSLISRFNDMTPQDTESREASRKRQGRGQRSVSGRPGANSLACPDCNLPVKTNSELKKHQARHKKPFKCDIEGCQKETEGFSTSNDLDRHKRCVHKLLKPGEVVYRCDLGSCKDKEKDWPRQDNFKQHLKRKHDLEGVDLSRFMFRSSDAADPTDPGASETFSGDTSAVANSDAASSWLGLGHAHVSPASLTTRIPSFAQTGGMTQFPRNPVMEERDFTLPRAVDSSRLSGSAGLEVGPVLSDAGIPQVSARGEIAPAIDTLSRVGDPAWVAPDSLSQTQPETRAFGPQLPEASPRQVAELEEDDEGPDVAAEDAQSERAEAESAVPDEMELDNPAQDSMSEDNLHDPDSEDDGPSDSTTDGQADLLRDTGAQYSSVDGVHLKSPSTEMQLAADAPRPIDLDDESQASAVLRSLMEKGMLGKLLKEVGYRVAEEAETKAKEQRPPANSSAPSDGSRVNKCQDCPKTFVRRCELKKHQKRHARPYACTFAKCDKTFGSKNDWKRHENSQHFQLEIWRCAEKALGATAADQECGKVCHRRESLKSHLERDHGIHDPATLERKLADCRMGRNFESRFWCGFCQKTIEPTGKGGPAHSERFDHIDDHFNGRGVPKADIKDWKHVDTDPLESSSSSPDSGSPARGRRDGSAARGGRPEWVHVPRSGSGFRKRPHSSGREGEASSRAKRAKSGRGGKRDTWWSCCSCKMYWSLALTNKCMDPCNHDHCSACEIFERSSTELRVQVRAPGQDQDTAQEDGLMA